MKSEPSNLRRPLNPMPDDVRLALEKRLLMEAFNSRPAYQQNDYLGWITRAKLSGTRAKRMRQMLTELETGGVYMKMEHPPSSKR